MSETSGKEEQVKNPDRRKFLKTAGKLVVAAAGSAAAGGIVANEVINKGEGGIDTDSGNFFPLYERHSKGIKVESIPAGLDVFFRETGGKDFSSSPKEVLRKKFQAFNDIPIFPDTILSSLSKSKTEIMIGDVETSALNIEGLILLGEIVTGGSLAIGFVSSLSSKAKLEKGIGRRKFLQAVMLAGAAWGLSKSLSIPGLLLKPNNENAINRIYNRLLAIESHAHPELSIVFFRNIMIADKLLTVSEDIRRISGQRARIAFQVGAGHAGIEDFLQAGHDFCRSLILAYPKWYLRSTVELNNGIRDFSSARLLKLPEHLTAENISNGERLSETTERRIVDERLEKALTLKLA